MDTDHHTSAPYQPKNIGVFEPNTVYTTATECHARWPQVSLATWKRNVSKGKLGNYILHKRQYYVTKNAAEKFAIEQGFMQKQ